MCRVVGNPGREADSNYTMVPAEDAKPVPPRKAGKKTVIFDFKIDYSAFPELAGFKEVLWEYLPEQNKAGDINWVYDTKWDYIKLEAMNQEMGTYKLKLSNDQSHFEAVIAPLLSRKDYKKAMSDFKLKMKDYHEKIQSRVSEMDRHENERSFLRTYSVRNFGLYNWDCIYNRPDFYACTVIFKIAGYPDLDLSNLIIYQIANNSKSIIRYYPQAENQFAFSLSDRNKLVTFLPGNKMAVFTEQDFQNMLKHIANRESAYTIILHVVDKKVTSAQDILASL